MAGPISMFVPAGVIVVLAIPLAFRLVPPNRLYGVRTAITLRSRELWFRVNRVAGLTLIAAAAVAFWIYLRYPDLASGRSVAGILVLVLPTLSALAVTGVYARFIVSRANE